MSLTVPTVVAYASANMPTSDVGASGGTIDAKTRVLFTDLTVEGYVSVVSTSASDLQLCTVVGRGPYGDILSETKALTGTTSVLFSINSLRHILRVTLASDAVGVVTVSSVGEVGAIPVGERGFTRLFYGAIPATAGATTRYEKIFIKNSAISGLANTIVAPALTLTGPDVSFAVTPVGNTEVATNRLIAPAVTVFPFLAQSAGNKYWSRVAVNSANGDVFSSVYIGDIWKQTAGTGSFVAQSAGTQSWFGVTVNSANGDVFGSVDGGDIYKQTAGTGSFVAQSAGNKAWRGVAVNSSNGDVFGCVYPGDIWKQTAGTGSFVAQSAGTKNWFGVSVNSTNGDVFGIVNSGDIYKQAAGTGLFVAQSAGTKNWYGVAVNKSTGDVFGIVNSGDIYKQAAGTGSFVAQSAGTQTWQGVAVNSANGDVFGSVGTGDIWKQVGATYLSFSTSAQTVSAGLAPAEYVGVWVAQTLAQAAPGYQSSLSLSVLGTINFASYGGASVVDNTLINSLAVNGRGFVVDSGFGYASTGDSLRLWRFTVPVLGSVTEFDYSGNIGGRKLFVYAGNLYQTEYGSPARITKITLSTMAKVSTLTLNTGENIGEAADVSGSDIYIASQTAPSILVKSDMTTMFRTSAVTLNTGENYPKAMVVTGGNAYIVTSTNPVIVVKVNTSSMTRTSSITLTGYAGGGSVVASQGFLYVGAYNTSNSRSYVIKIDLSSFTSVSSLELNTAADGSGPFALIVTDVTRLYAMDYGYVHSVELNPFGIISSVARTVPGTSGGQQMAYDGNYLYAIGSQYPNPLKLERYDPGGLA